MLFNMIEPSICFEGLIQLSLGWTPGSPSTSTIVSKAWGSPDSSRSRVRAHSPNKLSLSLSKLGFPYMVVPQNGWLRMENLIKMDDAWGYPYFRKPPNMTAFAGSKTYKSSSSQWVVSEYVSLKSKDATSTPDLNWGSWKGTLDETWLESAGTITLWKLTMGTIVSRMHHGSRIETARSQHHSGCLRPSLFACLKQPLTISVRDGRTPLSEKPHSWGQQNGVYRLSL